MVETSPALYAQSTKQGIDHETKDSLMKKTESSGLSNKSLYGEGTATHRWEARSIDPYGVRMATHRWEGSFLAIDDPASSLPSQPARHEMVRWLVQRQQEPRQPHTATGAGGDWALIG